MDNQNNSGHINLRKWPIPKGNTQPGVLQCLFELLVQRGIRPQAVLDIPCGEGEFLVTFKKFFPEAQVRGVDLFAKPLPEIQKDFVQSDMRDWTFAKDKQFDLITCISGVMQCDDVMGLFERSYQYLRPGGHLIVSNDHIVTIRDRLSFLLFGEVKRFRKYFSKDEGNWNLVLLPGLIKHYEKNGFVDIQIRYCSARTEDYFFILFLPLFYFFDMIHALFAKSDWNFNKKRRFFSISSYFARHYVLIAKKPEF